MSNHSLSDRAVSTHEVTSIVAQVLSLGEQRITLYNISWDTYELLLEAFGEHRAARLTYDSGVLEFMVPLEEHENPSDLIGVFIRTLVEESGWNIKSLASTTLKRSDLKKGAEPDKCYYIQNESLVRGRIVNLNFDPPPDFATATTVEITNGSRSNLTDSSNLWQTRPIAAR